MNLHHRHNHHILVRYSSHYVPSLKTLSIENPPCRLQLEDDYHTLTVATKRKQKSFKGGSGYSLKTYTLPVSMESHRVGVAVLL